MAYYRYSIEYSKKHHYPWLIIWEYPNSAWSLIVNKAAVKYTIPRLYRAFSTLNEVKEFIVILKQCGYKFKRVKKLK